MNFILKSAAFGLFICIQFASAQSDDLIIPEIIVSAELREQLQKDTPFSISVISEEIIAARNANHIEEIINLVPNVNFASGSSRARFFQIRGIGERSQFVDPINPSVGFLIDNVDFSGAGTIGTLLDVKQVEVLRGPQGTRYGANALAGLIVVKSNDPEPEFHARISADVGNYSSRSLSGMMTGPISDSWSYRIAVQQYLSDGFMKNDFLDKDDTNDRDELTARAKLRYDNGDDLVLDIAYLHADIDNGYDAFSLDNTRHTLSDEPGHDIQESDALSVRLNWLATSGFTVDANISLSSSDLAYGYDEDWSFTGIHPFGYTSTDNYIRERDTVSFEIKVLSEPGAEIASGTTAWLFGLYALSSEEDLLRLYTFSATDFVSKYDFQTVAAYVQLDSELTEALSLTTGLRLERRDTEYRNSGQFLDPAGLPAGPVRFSPGESFWGGRLALQYQMNDAVMTYASLSRGYKAHGFNSDGSLDADLREFDSEFLWEIELGLKGTHAGGRLQSRIAVFYDDREDQQVKSSITRVRPDGSTEFIDFIGNAAEGTNYGVEVEVNWLVNADWQLLGSLGLLRAEFDDYINEFGEDLSGRDQAHAPRYQFSMASVYHFSDSWSLRLEVEGKDDFFFSDRHDEKSQSYELVNLRLGYQGGQWQASLWGRNLTDKNFYTRAFGSFGNDPRKGYITEPYYQFGEPRVFGLSVTVDL